MLHLDDILEHWARIYEPLSHNTEQDEERKTFHRIDRLDGEHWLFRNRNSAPSPCLAYLTPIDAEAITGDTVRYHHGFFFLVKQSTLDRTNEEDQSYCKEVLNDMVLDLLAYLSKLKKTAGQMPKVPYTDPDGLLPTIESQEMINDLRGLQLDTMRWFTFPAKWNNWWILGVEMDRLESRKICIVESKYKINQS